MSYIIGMRSRCDDSYIGYFQLTKSVWTTDRERAYSFTSEVIAHKFARTLRTKYPAYAGFIDTVVTEEMR